VQGLRLLLPALIPSWRFFDAVAPSPRVEFALLRSLEDVPAEWHEFRPRPASLSVGSMIRRMFYNSRWNEALFVTSCAERLVSSPDWHSEKEILQRIKDDLARGAFDAAASPYLQFRLVFVSREGARLQKDILYVSPVYRPLGDAVA
jgi:hypothetical protein